MEKKIEILDMRPILGNYLQLFTVLHHTSLSTSTNTRVPRIFAYIVRKIS